MTIVDQTSGTQTKEIQTAWVQNRADIAYVAMGSLNAGIWGYSAFYAHRDAKRTIELEKARDDFATAGQCALASMRGVERLANGLFTEENYDALQLCGILMKQSMNEPAPVVPNTNTYTYGGIAVAAAVIAVVGYRNLYKRLSAQKAPANG